MKQNKEIIKRISAVFMLALLLLPLVSEIAHSFEDHEHLTCTEATTHLHELEADCSICDFHFNAFTFTPLVQITSYEAKIFLQPNFHPLQIITRDKSYSYLLRGPPQLQHNS